EGIEDPGLAVVRIAGVDAFHRLLVGDGSAPMITLVPIAIERLDGREIVSFSLGLRAGGLRAVDGDQPRLERRFARRVTARVIHAPGDAPDAPSTRPISDGNLGARVERPLLTN